MRNVRLLKTGGADNKPPRQFKTIDIVRAITDYNKFPVEG